MGQSAPAAHLHHFAGKKHHSPLMAIDNSCVFWRCRYIAKLEWMFYQWQIIYTHISPGNIDRLSFDSTQHTTAVHACYQNTTQHQSKNHITHTDRHVCPQAHLNLPEWNKTDSKCRAVTWHSTSQIPLRGELWAKRTSPAVGYSLTFDSQLKSFCTTSSVALSPF